MNKIKLFNRDGADLWLEEEKMLDESISEWKLKVDSKHKYCLEYLRIIGNFPSEIEAVDPSGGPMINTGDIFENKYKIIKIINPTTFWISNNGNN
jgi:hypothetical protein